MSPTKKFNGTGIVLQEMEMSGHFRTVYVGKDISLTGTVYYKAYLRKLR